MKKYKKIKTFKNNSNKQKSLKINNYLISYK